MEANFLTTAVTAEILKPAILLAAWTMIMWVWMYATRIPAMIKAQVNSDALANDPELTLDKVLPPQIQWKAHNYNHLHEAPTVFYAIAIILVIVCLLYTSPSPRDLSTSRMPSSA